jgi:hypothetical protein
LVEYAYIEQAISGYIGTLQIIQDMLNAVMEKDD